MLIIRKLIVIALQNQVCINVTFYYGTNVDNYQIDCNGGIKPGGYRAVEGGWGLPGQAEGPWDHKPERNYCGLAQVTF